MIFLYHLVTYPRTVIHTFDVAGRDYSHQVLIPFVVLRQEYKVIVSFFLFSMAEMLGHIHLTPHDRLYFVRSVRVLVSLVVSDFEKFRNSIHISVVRNGYSRHSELAGTSEELLDVSQTIQYGVLGMKM